MEEWNEYNLLDTHYIIWEPLHLGVEQLKVFTLQFSDKFTLEAMQ